MSELLAGTGHGVARVRALTGPHRFIIGGVVALVATQPCAAEWVGAQVHRPLLAGGAGNSYSLTTDNTPGTTAGPLDSKLPRCRK